jgi:hypothetical protein
MATPTLLLLGTVQHACDTDDFTAGTLNNEIFVQGSGSIGQRISGGVNTLETTTIPAALNFTVGGANEGDHIIMWFDGLNANDSDDFSIYVDEGADSGRWRVGPPPDYTGGFQPLIVDPATGFDTDGVAGAWGPEDSDNPGQLDNVTGIGGYFDITGTIAGNYHNCIIDQITVGTGVRIYAGVDTDAGNFAAAQTFDEGTNQYGFWIERNGSFVARGKLRIGSDTDSDGSTYFRSVGEVVAFADAPVAVGFYEVAVSEPNDTDITTAIFDGTIIIAADPAVARWSFTADTDSTPDITISSCVFVGWDVFTIMDSDISVSDTKFDDGTKMYHGPVLMDGCTFVNANTDSDQSLIETERPQDITNCDFTADVGGHAIELGTNTDTDFAFDGNTFTGYGADASESAAIYNNSGKAITINLQNTASTPTYRNGAGASTTILNTVALTIMPDALSTWIVMIQS